MCTQKVIVLQLVHGMGYLNNHTCAILSELKYIIYYVYIQTECMVHVHDNEVIISYIYGNFLLTIYIQVHFHKTVLTCVKWFLQTTHAVVPMDVVTHTTRAVSLLVVFTGMLGKYKLH